jgi:RNA polymerase sigma factor (TIGR02999 family)
MSGTVPAHPEDGTIERLMGELRLGNRAAAGELMELLWPDLRRLAAAKMNRERTDHTWQPTALVNELYIELVRSGAFQPGGHRNDRNAFMGLAAHMMMRLLIHHARPLNRRVRRVSIDEQSSSPELSAETLNDVEAVLSSLATVHPQLRPVVEMKVFEGLSLEEIAGRLNCSLRTVERRWTFAKHWLEKELA